jgi:RNA polymerase sigma factor (sigma-70 family)
MNARISAEEERQLVERARTGDREAESQLLIAHLPPAFAMVNRYARHGPVPKEDLEQEAALALLTAIRKFNPSHGVRLVTYAMWWVRVRLQRTCRAWYYLSQEPPADGIRWIENLPEKERLTPEDEIDLTLLLKLSQRRRTAIELVFGLNGCKVHTRIEMAAALGLRLAAANKLYIRALAQLRELVHVHATIPRRARATEGVASHRMAG